MKTCHDFHFKNDGFSSVSTELSPLILRLLGFEAILHKLSVQSQGAHDLAEKEKSS